jgi:hypothetical protein
MGPETGFAPTLRVTIYLRVSNQLPVFLVMVFDQYFADIMVPACLACSVSSIALVFAF